MQHKCPRCWRELANVVKMDLTTTDLRHALEGRVHASGGAFVRRKPLGFKVAGECLEHGLQQIVPMGVPEVV